MDITLLIYGYIVLQIQKIQTSQNITWKRFILGKLTGTRDTKINVKATKHWDEKNQGLNSRRDNTGEVCKRSQGIFSAEGLAQGKREEKLHAASGIFRWLKLYENFGRKKRYAFLVHQKSGSQTALSAMQSHWVRLWVPGGCPTSLQEHQWLSTDPAAYEPSHRIEVEG